MNFSPPNYGDLLLVMSFKVVSLNLLVAGVSTILVTGGYLYLKRHSLDGSKEMSKLPEKKTMDVEISVEQPTVSLERSPK